MIASIPPELFFGIAIVSLCVEFMYAVCLWQAYNGFRNLRSIRNRLENYAHLKSLGTAKRFSKYGNDQLSKEGHEILLGTLKKIEAKSSALTTMIVLVLSISLGLFLGKKEFSNYDVLIAIFGSLMILPTFAAFRGMAHLDQYTYLSFWKLTPLARQKKLQDDLLLDLIAKELTFRFSWTVTRYIVTILLLLLVVDCFYEILKMDW